MPLEPTVRSFRADEWRTYRALRLASLADSPDAFGSTHAGEVGRPDTHWSERLREGVASATDTPLVAEVDQRPVGLAWGRIDPEDPESAYLFQMWIAPEGRGMGAARLLLRAVIDWAQTTQVVALKLGVASGNAAAFRLYELAGFERDGEQGPLRTGSEILAHPMTVALRRHSE